MAIPINLVLWNSEIWSGNKADLKAIDTFHHKAIRRILHINMNQVKNERITNEEIRCRFNNIPPLSTIWRQRLLKFIGRSARQNHSSLSFLTLSLHIKGSRSRGRPYRTNKDAIVESLRGLIPSLPENGTFHYWFGYAKVRGVWEKMVSKLGEVTYRRYQQNEPNENHYFHNNHHSHNPPSSPRSHQNNNTPPSPPTHERVFIPQTKRDALQLLQLDPSATTREIVFNSGY